MKRDLSLLEIKSILKQTYLGESLPGKFLTFKNKEIALPAFGLIECVGPEPEYFIVQFLKKYLNVENKLIWVEPERTFYPIHLLQVGLDLDHILFIEPKISDFYRCVLDCARAQVAPFLALPNRFF